MSIYISFFLGLVVFTLFSFLWKKAHLNTHEVIIQYIKVQKKPLQNKLQSLSILHISDMHLEHISVKPEQILAHFRDQKIDIIALTGDFLDRKRSIPKLEPYLKIFNELKPRYGIYAVFGNHDYVLNTKDFGSLKDMLERYGCMTMQNQHKRIWIEADGDGNGGGYLNIIGIDDFSTNRSHLSDSYKDLQGGCNLVLTHDPNIVLQMELFPYDYLISGHFHGGQIHWPKPYHLAKMGKLPRMNMVKGYHLYHGKPFYISEGLGQTGVNIRVGSRPEMTIHDLCISS